MQVKEKTTRAPRIWAAECGRLSVTVVLTSAGMSDPSQSLSVVVR